jgi:hypothetical protein
MEIANLKLSDFATTDGSATSLKHLDSVGSFTIINVVDSNYDNDEGVRIFTQEKFNIGGTEYSEFYTTRTAIVDALKSPALRNELSQGNTLQVKIGQRRSKSNKEYFVLEDT